MDQIHELPSAIQDRLPEGPALTDWLLVELDRAHGAADRVHVLGCEATCRGPEVTIAGLTMMRALVLKHRAGPTYVTNVFDPTGPDVPGGWHCRECGLDRDAPLAREPARPTGGMGLDRSRGSAHLAPRGCRRANNQDRVRCSRAGFHDLRRRGPGL